MLNTMRVGPGEHLRGTGLNTWFGTALHFLGPSTHLSLSLGASSLPLPLASWEEGTVKLFGLTGSLQRRVAVNKAADRLKASLWHQPILPSLILTFLLISSFNEKCDRKNVVAWSQTSNCQPL